MTWFKVDDGFWSHPKTAGLSDPAIATWVRAGSYSCQHLTDGFISAPMLRMFGDADTAAELVAAGLWEPATGGWLFHDWAEYQETGEAVKKRREQARERQRRSRERRGQKPPRSASVTSDVTRDEFVSDAEGDANTTGPVGDPDAGDVSGPAKPQVANSVTTDVTRDTTREFSTPDPTVGRVGTTSLPSLLENSPTESSSSTKSPTPKEHREDVEALCVRLCDHIVANGSKRPVIGERWHREARLMLDRDGRELQKALNLIDWCQRDPFWRKNILSMPKFREKYDQLRLAALDELQRTRPAVGQPTKREMKIAAAERFKANPNPELMRHAGFDTRPGLIALPGGMQ